MATLGFIIKKFSSFIPSQLRGLNAAQRTKAEPRRPAVAPQTRQSFGIMYLTNYQVGTVRCAVPVAERSEGDGIDGLFTTFVPSCRTGTPQRGVPTTKKFVNNIILQSLSHPNHP